MIKNKDDYFQQEQIKVGPLDMIMTTLRENIGSLPKLPLKKRYKTRTNRGEI